MVHRRIMVCNMCHSSCVAKMITGATLAATILIITVGIWAYKHDRKQ